MTTTKTRPIEPIEENSANKENYTHAQETIDKVLAKVAALKESEANNELKRQIDELDTAYERAIRLRMMRIDTLTGHCEDRDHELVKMRKANAALKNSYGTAMWVLYCVAFAVCVYALDFVLPGYVFAVFECIMRVCDAAFEKVQTSALCSAIASCALTFAAQQLMHKFY